MLSRRSFLQLVGASVVAVGLRPANRMLAAFDAATYQGRAFAALPVYSTRDLAHEPMRYLWPDSVTTILDRKDGWYRIAGGWVQREGLQPMLAYDPNRYQFVGAVPFWAEVAAPIASVRSHCAADARLVARIGHGGVAQVIDALPGEPNGWYGVADEHGDLLGWTQGIFWRPLDFEVESVSGRTLHIDRSAGLMTAVEGKQSALVVPFSSGQGLETGTFPALRGEVGGRRWIGSKTYDAVPWSIRFGEGQSLAGVYWHNLFGTAYQDGPAVQVTPLIARWLYGWLGDDAHIVVE